MKSQSNLSLAPLLLSITIALGCGSTFTGKIAVKGNEPFTYLVLVTDKGDMKIAGPFEKKLREGFQGATITVRGTIVKEGRGFMSLPVLEVKEIVNSGD